MEGQESALVWEKPESPAHPLCRLSSAFYPFLFRFSIPFVNVITLGGSRADALKTQHKALKLYNSSLCPGGRATLRRAALPLTFSALSKGVNVGG